MDRASVSRAYTRTRDRCTDHSHHARQVNRIHIQPEGTTELFKLHESLTPERVMEACERRMTTLDNPGFCTACGNEQEGCEPDARDYKCEACGKRAVYGAEELLIMMA